MAENFLMYKGFPLVRNNNEIYYGNMGDECVVNIRIESARKENDLDIADKLRVTLMRTATDIDAKDMIVKSVSRDSLFEALNVANIGLRG